MKPFAVIIIMLSWLLFGCSPSKPDLKTVFKNGSRINAHGKPVTIEIVQLGSIEFPSGRVAPKDTMMLDVSDELDRSVPITTAVAEAVVARFQSGDERVAFLQVRFRPESAKRCSLAIRKISPKWHESYREAYAVDSGFGGFVDYM